MDGVTLPEVLHSKESYELLGFDSPTAELLYARFLNQAKEFEADFFEIVESYFEWHPSEVASCEGDDWDTLMIELGINDRLRAAILDEEFFDIRFTASCKFWLPDAMEMQWRALEDLLAEPQGAKASIEQTDAALHDPQDPGYDESSKSVVPTTAHESREHKNG